jgi:hypothetical protein
MVRGGDFSRRTLLKTWGASFGRLLAGSSSAAVDPIDVTLRGFRRTAAFQQRYRMDATILLLGAPIFLRRAAGGGYASVEVSTVPGTTALALQFAAGSDPARAHGLNRFGILREAIVSKDGSVCDLSFAGLMTRSHEESFQQARRALATAIGSQGVVARGRTSASTIRTWIETIDLAPDSNWSNLNDTLCKALQHEPRTSPRENVPGSATTFLHAMRSAALGQDSLVRRLFLHAGKSYWLETRRPVERPLEMSGTIHDLNGARCAEFRTAYAAGDQSGIPIRIEYRPRSFLRLTFEAEPEATQPPIPSVFQEESA